MPYLTNNADYGRYDEKPDAPDYGDVYGYGTEPLI
jgi:hypothetical protein